LPFAQGPLADGAGPNEHDQAQRSNGNNDQMMDLVRYPTPVEH
jgi:hypothetical protein